MMTYDEKRKYAVAMNEEFFKYGTTDGYIILPENVTEKALYRVDSFKGGKHTKEIFRNPIVARWVAEDRKKEGKHVFLLKEQLDGIFEVLEEI